MEEGRAVGWKKKGKEMGRMGEDERCDFFSLPNDSCFDTTMESEGRRDGLMKKNRR